MAPSVRAQSANERDRIACLTSSGWNPYLRLLYEALERAGIESEPGSRLTFGWLLEARRRVRWLHIHWPESLYRFSRGPDAVRAALSPLKLGLFACRLAFAHALGYRIVWTIHQLLPHDRPGRLDRAAARLLARKADVLVAHDDETAARASAVLGARRVAVVAHGSYVGVYPPGEGGAAARAELDAGAARVALCFGELRGYKDIDLLIEAFSRTGTDAILAVAGYPKDTRVADALLSASRRDPRIRFRPGFVREERVADLFAAADVAVVPRSDGGTSGSLILALSQGLPVVAADQSTNRSLLAEGEAGWLFVPGDSASLAVCLEAALVASDEDLSRRAERAAEQAAGLDWDESARRLAALLRA